MQKSSTYKTNYKPSFRLVARLGEYDLNTEPDCVQGVCADAVVRINVVEVHIPEGFDGSEEDIAVLELEHDAPYTGKFILNTWPKTWRAITTIPSMLPRQRNATTKSVVVAFFEDR